MTDDLTLDKVQDNATKAHGWCHLNSEVAFLAKKLREVEKELKVMKRKMLKDE